jgi:signal transduction histidine kinase
MPHGHCYLWNTALMGLHLVTDLLIGVAYVAISLTLAYFVHRAKDDIPFSWIFLGFGIFIIACGGTHFMEVWTLWVPVYWLSGAVKLLTAAASVTVAILLPPLLPKSLALIRSAKLSEQSNRELELVNRALQIEIGERQTAVEEIRRLNADLEERVRARTAELAEVNRSLTLDITHRKHADEEIQRLNQELERRVAARTAELTAANAELESFSYSVAHDLRAPIRQIDGFSRILSEEAGQDLNEDSMRYLGRIQEGARQAGNLVDDLLNLARVSRQALERRPTQLNELVRKVRAELETECASREIEWRIDDLWTARCDPALVKQVFVNLLSNALKFTRLRDRAAIHVGQTAVSDERVIFIRDNGAGFDMAYAGKLFGVFERLHRPRDFEGTGVGLANVQRILQKHGGRIWAEAELDKGATFFFTIPEGTGPAEP